MSKITSGTKRWAVLLVILTTVGIPTAVITFRYLEAKPIVRRIETAGGIVGPRSIAQFIFIPTLQGITQVEFRWAPGHAMTDADLRRVSVDLKRLPRLRNLILRNSDVTDEGLRILYDITTLRSINLSGTQVTDAGVEELRRALPQARVLR